MKFIVVFYIHRILSRLQKDQKWYADQVQAFVGKSRYRLMAFQTIASKSLARVAFGPNGPEYVEYTAESTVYLVERSTLWLNRGLSFAAGVASSLLVAFLSHHLI